MRTQIIRQLGTILFSRSLGCVSTLVSPVVDEHLWYSCVPNDVGGEEIMIIDAIENNC